MITNRTLAALAGIFIAFSAAALPFGGAQDGARLPPPAFPRAVDLWADGRPAEALAALVGAMEVPEGGEEPLEALVMRAALLAAAGKPLESEAAWLSAAARESSLMAFALSRAVLSHVLRGDPAGAKEILDILLRFEQVRLHADTVLAVADAYRESGGFNEASALYRKVLQALRKSGRADRARLGLAACLEAQGDAEGAVAELRRAQLYHLLPETFVDAAAAEKRLSADLGRDPRPFSEDQYFELAHRLRAASRFSEAIGVLNSWAGRYPKSRRADRIESELIETLYRMRANDEALSRCLAFYLRFPSSPLSRTVRYLQLRLAVRGGRTGEVRSLAGELRRGGSSRSLRHSAGVVLASYLVSIGDVEGGLDVYREVYRAATSREGKRSILWRAGVAALRAGQNQRAATNLRALVGLQPGGDLMPASLYWVGVAETRLGNEEAALRALLRLDERYPYHYYGVRSKLLLAGLQAGLSSGRLSALRGAVRPGKLEFPKLSLSSAARRHPLFKASVILARAGLRSEAAETVKRLLPLVPGDKALAYLAVRALAESGDHRGAVGLIATFFRPFLDRPAAGVPSDFWALAFPRPFWNEIREAAASQGVDPFLLLALMRQESRFDPAARSAAGAVGLFQIMPYTAARLGPQLGLEGVGERALMEPEINAAFGAGLFSSLMEQFNGFLVPAIAAYNAGEERVGAWWKAGRTLPDDLFIDSMPYSQTRGFVRQVLANYFTYNRLYQQAEPADGS